MFQILVKGPHLLVNPVHHLQQIVSSFRLQYYMRVSCTLRAFVALCCAVVYQQCPVLKRVDYLSMRVAYACLSAMIFAWLGWRQYPTISTALTEIQVQTQVQTSKMPILHLAWRRSP